MLPTTAGTAASGVMFEVAATGGDVLIVGLQVLSLQGYLAHKNPPPLL